MTQVLNEEQAEAWKKKKSLAALVAPSRPAASSVGTPAQVPTNSPKGEREEALALAERLGSVIPGTIKLEFWALPLLQALLARIEQLENSLAKLQIDKDCSLEPRLFGEGKGKG